MTRTVNLTDAQRAALASQPVTLPGVATEPSKDTVRALAMVAALITTHGRSYCGRMWGE